MLIHGVNFTKVKIGREVILTARYMGLHPVTTRCPIKHSPAVAILLAAEAKKRASCPLCGK